MAKGQHLSPYQQKIVRRYYQHLDTIALTKLAESATELFLCTDPKKAEKLWQSVGRSLAKVSGNDVQVKKVLDARDVKGLAQLVNDLSGK